MVKIIKKVINKILLKKALKKIKGIPNVVYLTFDDGPEEGITQFVLDELARYDFRATFFCTGKNAVLHNELFQKIVNNGHAIANHTFSHFIAYNISHNQYVKDVQAASKVIQSQLFRPPCGCLTLLSWLRLYRNYRIVYWSVNSGDSRLNNFNYSESINALHNTKVGDIVLFHFSNEHEKATRILLPSYLEWLKNNNLKSEKII